MSESANASLAVIIPAAGFGTRMNQEIAKQFIEVSGKTLLAYTVEKIQLWASRYQHSITIMIALSEPQLLPEEISEVKVCLGGKTRADSVANALTTLKNIGHFNWVMVHDAARPLVLIEDIEKLYQTVKTDSVGGILAEKITSTVKVADGHSITKTLPRDNLWLAQTPQLFRFDLLMQSLAANRSGLTDEASGIEQLGFTPKITEGSKINIKITTPEDLATFKQQVDG